MKSRTIDHLNQRIFKRDPSWALGVLDACNIANEYSPGLGKHAIGDCILAKLNLLRKGLRVRRRN